MTNEKNCVIIFRSQKATPNIRRSRVVGRARTIGNRVTVKSGSRVRISPSPPKNPSHMRWIFLSKPQAWHIITARSAVYITNKGRRLSALVVSHHASACISLRLDDIQHFVLMICNSYGIDDIHTFGVIWMRVPYSTINQPV